MGGVPDQSVVTGGAMNRNNGWVRSVEGHVCAAPAQLGARSDALGWVRVVRMVMHQRLITLGNE
jgi:hypothetical protein